MNKTPTVLPPALRYAFVHTHEKWSDNYSNIFERTGQSLECFF